MKAKDLLNDLADKMICARFTDSLKLRPGQTYARLPEKDKALLKTLKSEDISEVRWPREIPLPTTRK